MDVMGVILILVVALAGIVWLVRALMRPKAPQQQGRSAPGHPNCVEVLKQRYARGEIDRDEYFQKLRDIAR